jgi:hypothetical protein
MFTSIIQFSAPAAKEGAKLAIKYTSAGLVIVAAQLGAIGAAACGYGLVRGGLTVGRSTINGTRHAYGWATTHTPSKKAIQARIDRMTVEALADKASRTNGHAAEQPIEA